MFTDIVGYTALAQANEARALAALEGNRVLLRSLFPKFNGREVKTIVYFKKIAEENPDFPVVYSSLCQAYLRKSMFDEAMEAVERYCGLIKNEAEMKLMRAYVYATMGRSMKRAAFFPRRGRMRRLDNSAHTTSAWYTSRWATATRVSSRSRKPTRNSTATCIR